MGITQPPSTASKTYVDCHTKVDNPYIQQNEDIFRCEANDLEANNYIIKGFHSFY